MSRYTLEMVTETTAPAIGSNLPLLFTYSDRVFGNGFLAEVLATNGRALCVHETDGFWMYGLNPGGMSASGDTPDSAHRAFRRTFSKILVDIASEASDFAAFRSMVEEFFNQANDGYEADWNAAVEAVRRQQVAVEGLPRKPADSPRSIAVNVKHDFSVEDNKAQFQRAIAA